MSDSTSLPSHADQPRTPNTGEALAWDRVDGQIKTLQQQAQATQTSIQQLTARPTADPLTAITAGLPAVPPINITAMGGSVAVAAILVLAWWYVWKRPKSEPIREVHEQVTVHDPLSLWGTLHDPEADANVEPELSDPDAFMSMAQFVKPESTQPVAVQPQKVASDSKLVDIEL